MVNPSGRILAVASLLGFLQSLNLAYFEPPLLAGQFSGKWRLGTVLGLSDTTFVNQRCGNSFARGGHYSSRHENVSSAVVETLSTSAGRRGSFVDNLSCNL
jgi:hypothetical protein